jgi:hypothetical protein
MTQKIVQVDFIVDFWNVIQFLSLTWQNKVSDEFKS